MAATTSRHSGLLSASCKSVGPRAAMRIASWTPATTKKATTASPIMRASDMALPNDATLAKAYRDLRAQSATSEAQPASWNSLPMTPSSTRRARLRKSCGKARGLSLAAAHQKSGRRARIDLRPGPAGGHHGPGVRTHAPSWCQGLARGLRFKRKPGPRENVCGPGLSTGLCRHRSRRAAGRVKAEKVAER